MKKSLLYLVVVIFMISACGTPPLVAPETDVLPTTDHQEVTSTSPIAPAIEEKTSEPSPTLSNSGQVKYSAEKISLAPVDLRLKLPEISAQDVKTPQISFAGWSNSGQQFSFVALFPDGTVERWVMNIDGTGLEKIIGKGDLCNFTIWSPDDSQLLCYKHKNDGFPQDELWVTQLDTNKWVKLNEPSGIEIGDSDVYGSDQIAWLDEQYLLYQEFRP